MHHLRSFVLMLVLIVLSVAPATARQATPASPAASPVAGGAGWRVAKSRTLKLDGTAWSLSPDGEWIAGEGRTKGTFCVWATKDGAGMCQGKDLAIRPETITWAPDSSAVAFSLNAVEFLVDSDIYVFEINDQKLRDLTDDGIVKGDLLRTDKLTKPLPIDDVPAWSPDGTELAFVRTSWGKENHPTELMRIKRSGGEPTLIRTLNEEAGFAVYEPMRWLSDDRLLFTIALTDMKSTRNGIWQVGLDGKGMKLLLAGNSAAQIPAPWIADISPDGTFVSVYSPLIFGQFAGKQPAFFLVDLTNFKATPVQADGTLRVSTPPRFSPNGASLLYLGYQQGKQSLVVQQIATGQVTTLVPDANGAGMGRAAMRGGLQWATNDIVMLGSKDGARLLALASAG
jgi:hypothetical protein